MPANGEGRIGHHQRSENKRNHREKLDHLQSLLFQVEIKNPIAMQHGRVNVPIG
jgi:hypothetical protein